MQKTLTVILAVIVGLCVFTASAIASTAVGDSDLIEMARPVFNAIMSGQYWLATAGALVLAVALLRRYGVKRWAWLGSSAGAAVLVIVGAFGAALGSTLAAGAAMSGSVAWVALKVALAAAGGFSLLKALLVPVLERAAAKWPKVAPIVAVVLWVFRSPSALAKADASGAAAVKAKPAGGADGVTGAPEELK